MRKYSTIVLARLIRYSLDLLKSIAASNGLCLIDPATILENSLLFDVVIWLVIQRKIAAEITTVATHDSPTVSDVDNIHLLLDQQSHNGARPRFIQHVLTALREGFHSIQEICLRLLVAIDDGLPRILRELLVFYYELVQVVS